MDGNLSDIKNQGEKHISSDYKTRSKSNSGANIDKYRVTSSHSEYRPEESNTAYCLSQRIPTSGNNYPVAGSGTNSEWEQPVLTSGLTAAVNAGLTSSTARCDNSESTTRNSSVYSGCTDPIGDGYPSTLSSVVPTAVYLHNRTAIVMEVEDGRSATADHLLQAVIATEELGLTKSVASQVFALWMRSPLLEVQLKPHNVPYEIRQNWHNLITQYSHTSINRQCRDDPIISFQRNVFYHQQIEEKIKEQRILELLYDECRHNILAGRYPCSSDHYTMLGGIQARLELGPYNPHLHSTHYFREEQHKYLPVHVRKSDTWTWLPISSKGSAEVRLLEQYKRIPTSATNRKLVRKYLEFCWTLPFYGAAFFEGQIEQPVRGLMSLMTHQDTPVLVAINAKGIFVIDDVHCTVLIGLNYEDMSWDFAHPSKDTNPNCLPCLFLQFVVVENGARVSKILQVFSKQARLMDVLISGFVRQLKEKAPAAAAADEADRVSAQPAYANQQLNNEESHSSINLGNISNAAQLPSLSNKLSRLTLATFDENGHCIGQMGSWSFSY